ncbi:MAG: tetratricopeptide repeat protein [Abditibacteriota bacterium]|nr:tetratricopeptide repeat protein [Abditibacteriota bacterium]
MGIYKLRTDFATHLKVLLWVVLVIFVVGAIWSFGAAPFIKRQKLKETVIAVGEGNVQRSDYDAEWDRIYKLAQRNGMKSPLEFANLKEMIVGNMIDAQKLVTVAEEEGIIITKKDVKQAKEEKILEVLKQNRNAIMGDLSEDEEALDPRKDKAFLKTLSDNGLTIDYIIADANANVSDLTIKAELVQKQLEAKIDDKVNALTDQEVKDSYKTFSLSQIIISEDKSTPQEAKANADKAYEELKGGADFAKVKEKYSTVSGFPTVEYNAIDNPWMLPPKVGAAVSNLKEGDITEPIEANKAYYVCKVNKVTNNAPEKLDKKAIDDRKEQMKQSMMQAQLTDIQEKMDKITDINVKDPEFEGYYHCLNAEKAMTDENAKGEYQKAVECFTEALKKDEQLGKDIINAKLADVYYKKGDYKACANTLDRMLDGEDATTESYDLRALYGDALAKLGENEKALDEYKQALELNKQDPAFLDELAEKFTALGDNINAATCTAKADELREYERKIQEEQMKQFQEQMAKQAEAAKKAEAEKKAETEKKTEDKAN